MLYALKFTDNSFRVNKRGLQSALRHYLSGKPDCWTCSPRVEIGDLLFIYFVAPRSAVHFICRAASRPYVNRDIFVRADHDVSEFQWWVDLTPPLAVEPIPFTNLRSAVGGYLNLKGRSGKFLDQNAANQVLRQVRVTFAPSPTLPALTLQRIKGRCELPNPATMSLREWREIPSALLRVEKEVERYVVEPLLRFCGLPRSGLEIVPQFRMAEGVADYVVTSAQKRLAVIEVKQRIASPRALQSWRVSPHYQQMCRYAQCLDCIGILVDCDQILVFSSPRMRLIRSYERRTMTPGQLNELRTFLAERNIA